MHRLVRISLLIVLATAFNAWAAEDTLHRTFNVGDGGALIIDADLGKIDVTTGGSSVTIDVVRKGSDEELKKNEVTFEQSGNQVTVRSKYEHMNWGWGSGLRIEYNVRIPVRFNVNLRTSGGSINVADLSGTAECRTSGGHITVDEALDSLDANTSGGSIHATFARQPNGDSKLVTSGGSITVNVAPNVRFNVDAHTSGGSVSSELPITVVGKVEKHSLAGTLNGGGPKLEAKTSGGSVSLRKR